MNLSVLLFIITFSSFTNAKASVSFCNSYQEILEQTIVKDAIENEIQKFSQKKEIAATADKTLSQLLAAKSPLVSQWLSKPELNGKSEDDIVRAWRRYYTNNFVLSQYPHKDKQTTLQVENLVDSLLKKHLTNSFKQRMQKLFKQAQDQAIQQIESYKIKDTKPIIDRINKIELYWATTIKNAKNNNNPNDLIAWGIAYDPVANEINMGLESLFYPNDETYLAVFAHEIGHSFDSLRWSAYFKGEWPFAKIEECLRSEKSVKAQIASKTQLDQIYESFADWFAAEVVYKIPKIKKELVRTDLCAERKLMLGSSYPSHSDRLSLIYHANPNYQSTNKDSKFVYCSLN